nr:unnamed protein product [Spirometra erinaceieuropaei]
MHLRAQYCGLRWPDGSSRRHRRDEAPSGPPQEAARQVIPEVKNPRSNGPERRAALVARKLVRYKGNIAALSETRFSEQGQLEESRGRPQVKGLPARHIHFGNELTQRLDGLASAAAVANAALDENVSVKNRWRHLRDMVQSTAQVVLGRARR